MTPTSAASSTAARRPPPGNQNRLVHGFYASVLNPSDRTGDAVDVAGASLDAEIAIVRVAPRRLLGMLLTGATLGSDPRPLTAYEIARFTGLAFRGAGTVSRLLRARRALTGEDGALTAAIDRALDEVSKELGIPL